jgi:hypothetical protein
MYRNVLAVLCLIGVFAMSADAQKAAVEPIAIDVGTILSFHLQTRLNPADVNQLDALPKGTLLRIRMLSTVDSMADRDGSEFGGVLVSPILSGKDVIVPTGAEARVLLVLLRSRHHPEGFRYELLLTKVTANGKSLDLTASLNASLVDSANDRKASRQPPPTKSSSSEEQHLPPQNYLGPTD